MIGLLCQEKITMPIFNDKCSNNQAILELGDLEDALKTLEDDV